MEAGVVARTASSDRSSGFLKGIRVLEVADELGEFCGKVLAGLGADVIKIEPPGGSPTRGYGPFYQDRPHRDRSLHFWHYNFGKRGVTLDLESAKGRQRFQELVKRADVVLETMPRNRLKRLGLDYPSLRELNPGLVACRITPFGDDGPYADYKACDLVHLALGGVMMNCGYDALPDGTYDLPPIAPQIWQAYHIGGEMAALGILSALHYRKQTGVGQQVSVAIHEAIAKQTEGDLPNWIYAKKVNLRATCRHSQARPIPKSIGMTKDGRWIMSSIRGATPYTPGDPLLELLTRFGEQDDLADPKYQDPKVRERPEVQQHAWDVVHRFVGKFPFDRDIWRDAQDIGMVWGPERRPEENLKDPHWRLRQTFLKVKHPELGRSFDEVGARWMCPGVSWRTGPRAPLLGEHTREVLGPLLKEKPRPAGARTVFRSGEGVPLSRHGKPWAMSDVKIIDLSWLLASAGGSRFLSAMGADVIRVEHLSRPDFIRWHSSTPPPGLREERDRESGPFFRPQVKSPNWSGFFNEINAGRRSLSLNLGKPEGKEILRELLADADIVAEGFTPGTLEKMGFGWNELRKLNPRLIYVQQSGMGQIGSYGRARSFGPIAQAFSGMSEMSGLPEPHPPAGIGYSFLDWFGAYNMALAMLAGLHYRDRSGKGVWIDSSQVEAGTYLVSSSILDFSANGRRWYRFGNRSPYKRAAPHGAYRCEGTDRWIAIGCFTDAEWKALAKVLRRPGWTKDARFRTLDSRIANQGELDVLIDAETRKWERYTLQAKLQAAGVPAGVCQTAEDRCENDPQLKHLNWLVELPQSEIGTWPVKEHPARLSETPPWMGSIIDRHGPNYGEDTDWILRERLGYSEERIAELRAAGVL